MFVSLCTGCCSYIKAGAEKRCTVEREKEVVNRIIRRWRLFRLLKQMPAQVVNDSNGLQRVILSKPCGSSAEITGKSHVANFGGISICFPQATSFGPLDQHEYPGHRLWSLDQTPNARQSSVNLILKSSDNDLKAYPCRFELRLNISVSPRKLTLIPSVTNVNRTYLNTPPKIAIIDHGKKRTFVLHKQDLPDAVVWNRWDKPSKNVPHLGDDYKTMVSVDSAVFEKPIVLKPFQVWRGFQEIATVSSSYCSGQLDPTKVLQNIT